MDEINRSSPCGKNPAIASLFIKLIFVMQVLLPGILNFAHFETLLVELSVY